MKHVLVTGGAGFLGSHIVEKLLNQGYKVRVLDNLSFGDDALQNFKKNSKFELINGDIRDLRLVLQAIQDIDSVIHLAGIVGDQASMIDPTSSFEVNYLSTKVLVDIAKYFKVKNFFFASSCSVYGFSNSKMLTESSKLSPLSLYAETKLKSERLLLNASDRGFTPTIFRMGTLYGLSNRMRFDLVVNFFTGQAISENEISIDGGNQWRPFVHVEDAANAFVLALGKSKIRGVFNLGSNEQNHQIKDIGEFILKSITNVKIKQSPKTDRRDYRVSFSKIKKTLGFKAQRTIIDGIEEIKQAIKSEKIKSWKNPIYYNNRFPLTGKNKNSKYYWK